MVLIVRKAAVTLLCALALTLNARPARSGDPPAKQPPMPEEPLPAGAVARLGSLRLVHCGPIAAVAVSPDGKVAASGVPDVRWYDDIGDIKHGAIRLWDTRTGKRLRELSTPAGKTMCLRFSRDGRQMYVGCGDHLCCWDVATGRQRWVQNAAKNDHAEVQLEVTTIVEAGDRLITVHTGTLQWLRQLGIRIWDRQTGAPRPLPAALESSTNSAANARILFHQVAISADGSRAGVMAGHWANVHGQWEYSGPRLRIIDLHTGACQADFAATDSLSTVMALSHDGRLAAVAVRRGLWLLDVDSGRKQRLAENWPVIERLMFASASRQLAARSVDRAVRVWDCATGQAVASHRVAECHFDATNGSPVIASAHSHTVRLYDRESGRELLPILGHRDTPTVQFGRDHVFSWDRTCTYRWRAGSWQPQARLVLKRSGQGNRVKPQARVVHLGSQTLVEVEAVTDRRELDVAWERSLSLRGASNTALTLHHPATGELVRILDGDGGPWLDGRISADGTRGFGQQPQQTLFFDVASGKRLAAVDNLYDPTNPWRRYASAMSPHGRWFAQGHKAGVTLFEVDTGKPVRQFAVPRGGGAAWLMFAPDERWLLAEVQVQMDQAKSASVTIVLWDTGSGTLVQQLTVPPWMVAPARVPWNPRALSATALSPDGRRIALAGADNTVIDIWDTASGTRRGVLAGHFGPVRDLAFSPDGRYLASASADTTVLIWDMHRPLHPVPRWSEPAAEDFAAAWRTLTERNAANADAAIWRLIDAGKTAVPFLRAQFNPDDARVKRLLRELDSDDFDKRDAASRALAALGEQVVRELEAALKQPRSLEHKRRVESLLRAARPDASPFGSAARIRDWRMVEVLERIANPAAVALLRELAAGPPSSPLTVHAAAALARLRQ